MREGSQPYLALPRRVAYVLQDALSEDLERLQRQQIIVPLDIDLTSKWCNSIVLVLKANSKLRLCLDLTRLNKDLIRPIHRDQTPIATLPRLVGVKYFTLIDTSLRYHNLKLD